MDEFLNYLPPQLAEPAVWKTWIIPLMLGLGLAAATGLKTFLPLLMLAAAARLHLFGINLSQEVAWMTSNATLAALGLATVIELVADKFAVVDKALRGINKVIRPLAAALAAFAVLGSFDPLIAALAGLILGAPAALVFGAVQSGSRAGGKTARGEKADKTGHAVVAWIQEALVIAAVLVVFVAPSLTPVVLAVVLASLMLMWWIVSRVRRRMARRKDHATLAEAEPSPA